MNQYVTLSLESHLFFGRIMKEHALFLMAGFPAKNEAFIEKADWYRAQFEDLLAQAVKISNGTIRQGVLKSGEIFTEYTIKAEKSTSCLTGISIDTCITEDEMKLVPGDKMTLNREQSQLMARRVRMLNERALELVTGLIRLKEEILEAMTKCKIYNSNYPLLIRHIIREAKLYKETITELNTKGYICSRNLKAIEKFWNQIMMEHALFIRGLLDPSEEELIEAADAFAGDYKKLIREAREMDCRTMDGLTRRTIEETVRYREFKAAGTKGITECRIESIILPLLADHVLREASHYLRILQSEAKR